MIMNRIQKIVTSAAVVSLLAAAPFFASASSLNASSSARVGINHDGIVRVIGADVTAVGNGFVNAMTTFGSTILNWVVNISAATKIQANGSTSASTTDIKVGDHISFTGALTNVGSSLSVAASKIRDLTTFPAHRFGAGTVLSVNASEGSFVISKGRHTVTVQTNASTTIKADGSAATLSSLQAGDKVKVAGTASADGSVVTASNIVVKSPDAHKSDTDNDNEQGENKSSAHAGIHLIGGLHLGDDD